MAKSVLRTSWPHSRWCQVTPSCLALLLASGLATLCLCQPSQWGQPFTMWRCTRARGASWHALQEPVLALSAKVCPCNLQLIPCADCVRWHAGFTSQSINTLLSTQHLLSYSCLCILIRRNIALSGSCHYPHVAFVSL